LKFKYIFKNNLFLPSLKKTKKYKFYFFKKFLVKSRKKLTKVNYNQKNKFISLLHKFFCISMKSGNKLTLFKHFELFFQNYLISMFYKKDDEYTSNDEFFINYLYFDIIRILIKKKAFFFNFNKLLSLVLPAYDTLFSIKIKKLNKKLRLKYKKKYVNMIVYIPDKNRNNLTLKFLNIQSFSVRSYNLHERYFRIFLMFILAPYRTLPWRRRHTVYRKIVEKYKKLN